MDAPLIAVMWLFLFAKTWRVNYHPWEAYVVLALVVWTIRIFAKLLEASMLGDEEALAMRHRTLLKRLAIGGGVLALVLTVLNFPLSVYNYLLLGGILVLGYLALALFSSPQDNEISYAKHVIGGVAFAYGTALIAHVYLPNLGIIELFKSREFICFAVLCLLASSATDLWAHSGKVEDREIKAADELALTLPLTLLGAAALVFAVQNEAMTSRPFFYGILTGAALLQVLNRTRGRFPILTLKVLTGVCLMIPGVVFQTYPIGR
ncbi:MAG: hypothetical protein H7Y36_07110 [Armatimonadetes bacterium]|nr:hypothetical protein [Akkermansiaceae bacterium]